MKIRLLDADDWVGLYIDGRLVIEGHELWTSSIIRAIAPDADFRVSFVHDLRSGRCPQKWSSKLEEGSDEGGV